MVARRRHVRVVLAAVVVCAGSMAIAWKQAAATPDGADPRGVAVFATRLRTLLAHRCAGCHGAGAVESGFDMSTREKLLAGGRRGPAVVPGKASASLLYRLAARLEEPHMPEEGDVLTPEELGWLAEWIDLGAPFDRPLVDDSSRGPWTERVVEAGDRDHWAFRPLAAVGPPLPADPRAWCRNEIDRFVLAKLEAAGIEPSPQAPAQTLLRRLSFDLTGLPPTPHEVAAFCASDPHDSAYEEAVDGLLARPSFGERWAQHWLDVARFAESFGYEQDYERPHAYHYRDFVIRAFNDDLPYDTFVQWQIAGDELAPENLEAQKATGFLAAGAFPTQLTEKEFESARAAELDDMLGTVGTAVLAATIGCARCHDHKFDPIPQADYYRMAAVFTTTIRSNVELRADPVADRAAMSDWEARLATAVRARDRFERHELPDRFASFAAGWKPGADAEPTAWRLGTVVSAEAKSGTRFVSLGDGSLLATGHATDQDTYTFVIDAPMHTVAALRLDALADPSLPRGGPGRVAHGNFAVSHLAVSAAPVPVSGKPVAKAVPVKLVRPRADFSQATPALDVANAIDGDATSAWAIDPKVGVSHVAAFDFQTPVTHRDGVRLIVTLEFKNNGRHAIGRPRLSFSATAGETIEPVTPERDPLGGHREARARVTALLGKPFGERTADEGAELRLLQRQFDADWLDLDAAVRRIEAEKPAPTLVKVLVASENVPKIPHHADGRGFPHFYPETHFLRRGDVAQKEGVASPGFLQVLVRHPDGPAHWQLSAPPGATTSHRRAALARWITDADCGAGHLAARVIVNRLWQHHFGEGLVTTPSDFGRQSEPPSHPELLDWLAAELIRNGWRLKPLHRLMVTSAAYRQSSGVDPAKQQVDPTNRLVWRFNRRRLEGEAIRDTLLSISGALDASLYGRGGRDETSLRRSLYLDRRRSRLPLFLRTFDAPDFVSGVARRSVTTTAPQALALMNSPAVRSSAERLARRVVKEDEAIPVPPAATEEPPAGDGVPDARGSDVRLIRSAYAIAIGRAATPSELHDALLFLDAQRAAHAALGQRDATGSALADFCQVLMGLNETMHIE